MALIREHSYNAETDETIIIEREQTPEEIAAEQAAAHKNQRDRVIAAADDYLNSPAKALGFDGIKSLGGYRDSHDPSLRILGQAAYTWETDVWVYWRGLEAAIKAGTRTPPDTDTLWAELPDPPEVLITGQAGAMQTLFTRFKSFLGL